MDAILDFEKGHFIFLIPAWEESRKIFFDREPLEYL
jgi:hypothetical protein